MQGYSEQTLGSHRAGEGQVQTVWVYPLREAHFTATSIWKWAWVSSKGPVFP